MKISALFLILTIFISGCTSTQPVEKSELDEFAKCLKESGLEMYGSMTCSVCKKQRDLFGSSFQFVGEIECHPQGENSQTELCLEKNVERTPTWIINDEKHEGYQTLETLSELSGCVIHTHDD